MADGIKTGAHLARRFFGSLSSRPPADPDVTWVLGLLNEGQAAIWQRMSAQDQRHAIAVARDVASRLTDVEEQSMASGWFGDSEEFGRVVVIAGLMHDCGKVVANFGTMARVGATVLWVVMPPQAASRWERQDGLRRRLADYRSHPAIGGLMLSQAESHRLVHTWAAEHHRHPENWTVPSTVGLLLKDCDDD